MSKKFKSKHSCEEMQTEKKKGYVLGRIIRIRAFPPQFRKPGQQLSENRIQGIHCSCMLSNMSKMSDWQS